MTMFSPSREIPLDRKTQRYVDIGVGVGKIKQVQTFKLPNPAHLKKYMLDFCTRW